MMQKRALPPTSKPTWRKKPVTIKDIAAKLKISFQAVSQALNPRENTTHVSEATRKRIEEAALKMGYRRHQAAGMLRSRRSGQLGVLIFDHPHHLMHHRLHHVLAEIQAAGYRPFVHLADTRSSSGVTDGCLTIMDANVEGVLLVDPIGVTGDSPANILLEAQIPVVSIGTRQWSQIASYQADRKSGYHALTKHLLQAGARSLVLLHVDLNKQHRPYFKRFIADMATGFRNAITEGEKDFGPLEARVQTVKLAMDHEETEGVPIHPIYRSGYAAMKELLLLGDLPDALLCQADCWAQGALRACYESGVQVPTDLLITGFNNEPGSSAGSPPITTIAQPYAEIARRAIADVIAQIQDGKVTDGRVIAVPGFLIERTSSRKPKNPSLRISPSLQESVGTL